MAALFEKLKAGTEEIIPQEELKERLSSGEKLRIKLGADATSPDLHLGHAVVLSKLKLFQDYGHEVIFLIGDFTTQIGDPSGRSQTRPTLSQEEIARNTQTYLNQVSQILDQDKLTIRYNSQWLSDMNCADIIRLCSHVTLSRIIERDDFSRRIRDNIPIAMHELLYPLMQGYDSVALSADVELGGTDQMFNLLMGRFLQEQYGQRPQVVMTCPILEGLDGVQKMSKSLGNAIGLTEAPHQAFGKLMSISDELMWRYYTLLLNTTEKEIETMQQAVARDEIHPMELKKQMSYGIIKRFWGEEQAEEAAEQFRKMFQQKDYSHAETVTVPQDAPNPILITHLLTQLDIVTSNSQAKRLMKEGAVSLDGRKITDPQQHVSLYDGMVLKAGKHKIFQIQL